MLLSAANREEGLRQGPRYIVAKAMILCARAVVEAASKVLLLGLCNLFTNRPNSVNQGTILSIGRMIVRAVQESP